jgi:hypothetical protein
MRRSNHLVPTGKNEWKQPPRELMGIRKQNKTVGVALE